MESFIHNESDSNENFVRAYRDLRRRKGGLRNNRTENRITSFEKIYDVRIDWAENVFRGEFTASSNDKF